MGMNLLTPSFSNMADIDYNEVGKQIVLDSMRKVPYHIPSLAQLMLLSLEKPCYSNVENR
jgi:hypothetical protein